MTNLLLLLLSLSPQAHTALPQPQETYDEFISPKHLWIPFARQPQLLTSDYDVLESAQIKCRPESFANYGLELDTSINYLNFTAPAAGGLAEGFLSFVPDPITNFPPENSQALRAPLDFLRLNYFSDTSAGAFASASPTSLMKKSESKIQCRWLREYSSMPPAFPAVALYCQAENFTWQHQQKGANAGAYTGQIGKAHLLLPFDLESGPDVAAVIDPLNALEVISIKNPAERKWIYLPGENPAAWDVFRAYADNPLRKKKIIFFNDRCTLELVNRYQGQ